MLWDPKPAPGPLNLPPATSPRIKASSPQPNDSVSGRLSTLLGGTLLTTIVKPEPIIKQEPTYTEYSSANAVPAPQQGASLQRAGQFIQDRFGQAANGSLSALQSAQATRVQAQQTQQTQQGQTQPQPQINGLPMTTSDASRQAYNRLLAEQMRQQQARTAGQQRPVANGQTDGADEWKAFVAERRALTDEAILNSDMTLRERIEQSALELEGGGLMLPASQVKLSRVPVRRNPNLNRAQVDGADSDEDKKIEEDEDAINSDLDDPDENEGVNDEDEDNNGEVMVCLYDKVQRVKNKWKCTLKDGILSTGGKEYVLMSQLTSDY